MSSVKYYSERPQNVLKVFVKDLLLNMVTYERLGAQTFEMTHGLLGDQKDTVTHGRLGAQKIW